MMSTCEAGVVLGRNAAVVGGPAGGQRVGEGGQLDERAGDDVLVAAVGVQRVRRVANLQTMAREVSVTMVARTMSNGGYGSEARMLPAENM